MKLIDIDELKNQEILEKLRTAEYDDEIIDIIENIPVYSGKNENFVSIIEQLRTIADMIDRYSGIEVSSRVLRQAAETIESFPTDCNKWIPCSERMPESEQCVLLSLKDLSVSTGFKTNMGNYFFSYNRGGYILFEDVLAWRYLPEAYH